LGITYPGQQTYIQPHSGTITKSVVYNTLLSNSNWKCNKCKLCERNITTIFRLV